MHLQPVKRWAGGVELEPAGLPHLSRSYPMERMLRMIWAGDSSKEQYRALPPWRQTRSRKAVARLVFPVPAVPETKMLLPR